MVLERLEATGGVGVERVAAVDHDVALVQERDEIVDHGVDDRARLDQQDDLAGSGECTDELFERLGAAYVLIGRGPLHELLGGRGGPVVHRHRVAVIGEVEHQVLAHDGQPDQTDVCACAHGVSPIAGSAHGSQISRTIGSVRPTRGAMLKAGGVDRGRSMPRSGMSVSTSGNERDATMSATQGRAWTAGRFGAPGQVLSYEPRIWDEPGEGAVLVEVIAAGVGLPDLLMTQGSYPLVRKPPVTPGQEVCGRVVSTSAGSRFSVGDRIFGPTYFSAGSGGFATHTYVTDRLATIAPASLSDEEAAGFFIGFRTAYTALVTRTKLEAGETVLVLGGSGGTGAAAISLAKALGARVLAVASSDARRAFCLGIGADAVIGRDPDAIRSEVAALTGDAGCDVVIDPVGGEIAHAALDVVARYGRFATIGYASGSWPMLNPIDMVMRNYSVVGVLAAGFTPEEDADHNAELIDLADKGRIRTPIGPGGHPRRDPRGSRVAEHRSAPGKAGRSGLSTVSRLEAVAALRCRARRAVGAGGGASGTLL